MKSLAHPDWPYIGTPHEWPGFADKIRAEGMKRLEGHKGVLDSLTPDEMRAIAEMETPARMCGKMPYQRLNFGPELT